VGSGDFGMRAPFESPLEPFESPKELLNGAKERITDLEAACQAVCETRDYEIRTHIDPKTCEKVVRLRLKNRFPPKIRGLASNILKELRLSLDQAFCDAAIALGRSHAKGIYFPLARNPNDLEGEIRKKCVNVDRRIINYCLLFKPYYGGDSDGVLWSMSNLAGSTHQHIIGAGFQDTTSFAEAVTHASGTKIIINKWNDLHNELEVARVSPGSLLQFKNNFTLRLDIVFGGRSHSLSYCPIVRSLRHLQGIVMSIVLGLEAETYRILREDPASVST
jgi:hypothetical protein